MMACMAHLLHCALSAVGGCSDGDGDGETAGTSPAQPPTQAAKAPRSSPPNKPTTSVSSDTVRAVTAKRPRPIGAGANSSGGAGSDGEDEDDKVLGALATAFSKAAPKRVKASVADAGAAQKVAQAAVEQREDAEEAGQASKDDDEDDGMSEEAEVKSKPVKAVKAAKATKAVSGGGKEKAKAKGVEVKVSSRIHACMVYSAHSALLLHYTMFCDHVASSFTC
jgi:hypothetical protein